MEKEKQFDHYVVGPDNQRSFVGIETKLTEPFSQKEYDGPAYRRWSDRKDSPWPKEAWPKLADIRHNQLWRDRLLSVAMTYHPKSPYSCGYLMLVYHPDDTQCAETKEIYRSLLKPEDKSFLDYPLGKLIKTIELQLEDNYQQNWLTDFKKRYLDLSLSEKEFGRHEST